LIWVTITKTECSFLWAYTDVIIEVILFKI